MNKLFQKILIYVIILGNIEIIYSEEKEKNKKLENINFGNPYTEIFIKDLEEIKKISINGTNYTIIRLSNGRKRIVKGDKTIELNGKKLKLETTEKGAVEIEDENGVRVSIGELEKRRRSN